MNTKAATPAKLRDGTWGARVVGTVSVGDYVRITTKAGKSWVAEVATIVWSGDDATLVTTNSVAKDSVPKASSGSTMRRHGGGGGRCRGSGCSMAAVRDGYCRQCHFDEFDC